MIEFHVGNVYTKVNKKLLTKEEADKLHLILAVKSPGYYFVPSFRRGFWDGYVRFYNRLTGTFYSGLLNYVIRHLQEFNYSVVDDRVKVLSKGNPLHLHGIELRDYQVKMVNEAVKQSRGIIAAPVNSGKCLHGDTQISLADGTCRKIKDLKSGDEVISLNENFEQEVDIVEQVHSDGVKPLSKITTSNGRELIGTENHPILVGLEFKCIKDLELGDLIGTIRKYNTVDSFTDRIKSITEVPPDQTYNLTTKKYHNFVANEIYTHNTEIACGIMQVLGLPANFITHRLALLNQTKERIETRLNTKVGILGGGQEEIKDVNVLSIQSLHKKLEDPKIKELMQNTPVTICDECHHVSAKTFEMAMKASGSIWRFGLSATSLLRDDVSNMMVRGLLGDEISTVTNQDLMQLGISATPSVYLWSVETPNIPSHYTFDQAYDEGILNNEYRNNLIVSSAKRFLSLGKSVFILVWRIPHGDIILDMLKDEGIKAEYIRGGTQGVNETLKRFDQKELKCLVSSTISDEGIDVSGIDVLIMGVGFKAPLKVIQRVGRGQRKKRVGENVVTIVDFMDFHSRYLRKHSESRCSVYMKMGVKIYEILDPDWRTNEFVYN